MSDKAHEFDFAISYAGEDRDYVNGIAEALRDRGARVFYDQFVAADLWGVDLYTRFDEVYRNRSMYVVAFISRHYVSKPWPMHERQSYQARMLEEALPYFLPIRLDNSAMPGLRPTLGYIDAKAFTPSAIVDMLIAKLDGGRNIPALPADIITVPRT